MQQMSSEQVIANQRHEWSSVASAWEKWDEVMDRNLSFINYCLVGSARVSKGHRVLDLGSGTGYPALLAAQAASGDGRVTGLDLSEEMLAVARRKATRLGVSNADFRSADVTRLPFEAASFDAVTTRFCLMFLPEIPAAALEIARVLKPGGYVAAAVWSSPEKNPFIALPMGILRTHVTLPPPDPEQPGVFRLAKAGDLAGMLEKAGLIGVADSEVEGEAPYESVDQYFESLMELAAPLKTLFSGLSGAQRQQAESEIKTALGKFKNGSSVRLPMAIRLVVARKPS